MTPARAPCTCCGGSGRVEGATGAPRPCSRCNLAAFRRWCAGSRPLAPAALVLPVKPGVDRA